MKKHPILRLKAGRERSALHRHPWIFSGAVESIDGAPSEGDVVEIRDSSNTYRGTAHYYLGSITARILTFEGERIDAAFWTKRIRDAAAYRAQLFKSQSGRTTAYRLIHGEGDQLPGLVIDRYDSAFVIETHTSGMSRSVDEISAALCDVFGAEVKTVFLRDLVAEEKRWLKGDAVSGSILEHGHQFEVNWSEGQKTGFFLDQRENRRLLAEYAAGKTVLNTFSYTGGFSVYALAAGARRVVSVDSSKSAIAGGEINVARNGGGERHASVVEDVKRYLKEPKENFDLIILDPPAFAKNRGAVPDAARAYQRINEIALAHLPEGGLLFTFSCSQAVDRDLFRKIVFSAAAKVGKHARILHQLTQPGDHPVSIFHPEGEYLKGLVLGV